MERRPHPLHASPLRPCPYLAGRNERVIATELVGPHATELYSAGIQAGFRRSHNFMYRPACPACDACRPVRVQAKAFTASRSLARVARANRDLVAASGPAKASTEQYGLFTRYQSRRHPGGGMDRMSYIEYQAMLETSPVETLMTEFRNPEGDLVAVMLADETADGLSAVYSFFDPAEPKRALGTYMILWLIGEAARRGLPHLYLGYWIEGCAKMDYKSRFRPLEILGPEGWSSLAPADGGALEETV
ncbi:MAG: arginyltransferase [Alphaproteobacteria bacterium]|nr:arginyltransferase [Alphaproteobacteria bacterium]